MTESTTPILVSIEGNIGAGKSSFLHALKSAAGTELLGRQVIFLQEPVDEWQNIKDKNGVDILTKFYGNQEEYAFKFQMMAYISRQALVRKAMRENPNSIIVLDAFASLISGIGLDENKPEATEPIRFLTEALPLDATPILLHHSSKSRSGERASNAARGSNALTAEASQIIKMDWLGAEEHDQRIQISTQGRNSTPVDLIIEQTARSHWFSHGSTASVSKK